LTKPAAPTIDPGRPLIFASMDGGDILYKLDNPAWHALAEIHRSFAVGNFPLKRYQKNIVSFFAYDHGQKDAFLKADEITDVDESFFIIGDLPVLPKNYNIENRLSCVQMTCFALSNFPEMTDKIDLLDEDDEEQMLTLINNVQPGYFLPGTRLMGDYYGIRQKGELVAITGERMRMNGLAEISAVVTHPEFTGRKFAQQLVAYTVKKDILADIIPFLHVAESNERAIGIYSGLGFSPRRLIDFWKIKRTE